MIGFTALGILLGALPGINVSMSLILALPLTYNMDSKTAMCVLLSCYVGAMSGGLISAIALNIPGTGSSIATTFDGHPMAQQGRAGEAISVGILTSFVGGAISFILLIFIAPLLASVALKFGPWEYFAVGVFSITMIISVAGDDLLKGVLAAFFGMCLATTGTDPIGYVNRYNFGLTAFNGGVTTTALLCGMFAIPELLKLAYNLDDKSASVIKVEKVKGYGISLKNYLSHWKNIIVSALIGAYVGILPGIGGSSASLLAYLTQKNNAKDPEMYGKGNIAGLIASETANNACIGGSIIPMLALGVPGSSTSAIVMSALALHNVQCGPLVFSQNVNLVYIIFAIFFIANAIMLIVERVVLPGYLKVLLAPRRIIMVVIMLMCFLGAYSARGSYADVFVFVIGGAIGYFLTKANINRAPIILGYILSGMIELNLGRALSVSRGKWTAVFSRPIALVFLAIAVFSLTRSLIKSIKNQKKRQEIA